MANNEPGFDVRLHVYVPVVLYVDNVPTVVPMLAADDVTEFDRRMPGAGGPTMLPPPLPMWLNPTPIRPSAKFIVAPLMGSQ
jgi:hypothetical protein